VGLHQHRSPCRVEFRGARLPSRIAKRFRLQSGRDVAEKEESGSKLDGLLERIPIMDGGGRRRLTAGTIVVLTVLILFKDLRDTLTHAIAAKDVSISLVLAGGALLIYATGVIVELVGEVFLARAVANVVWSYVDAGHYAQRWKGFKRPLAWVFVVVCGTVRSVGYFVLGLFGGSRWRMRPLGRLSGTARRTFEVQPFSVRDSIEQPLGANAEFGRKALIDQLATAESRRWARRLMDRPKDVLALVSAIVFSLLLYLATTPIYFTLKPETKSDLKKLRVEFREDMFDMDRITPLDSLGRFARSDMNEMLYNYYRFTDPSVLARQDINSLTRGGILQEAQERCDNVADQLERRSHTDSFEIDRVRSFCLRLEKSRIYHAFIPALNEIDTIVQRQYLIRSTYVLAAMFLYIAFFNTLSAATVTVIEALALERPESAAS
jgi:hypothetical protein